MSSYDERRCASRRRRSTTRARAGALAEVPSTSPVERDRRARRAARGGHGSRAPSRRGRGRARPRRRAPCAASRRRARHRRPRSPARRARRVARGRGRRRAAMPATNRPTSAAPAGSAILIDDLLVRPPVTPLGSSFRPATDRVSVATRNPSTTRTTPVIPSIARRTTGRLRAPRRPVDGERIRAEPGERQRAEHEPEAEHRPERNARFRVRGRGAGS